MRLSESPRSRHRIPLRAAAKPKAFKLSSASAFGRADRLQFLAQGFRGAALTGQDPLGGAWPHRAGSDRRPGQATRIGDSDRRCVGLDPGPRVGLGPRKPPRRGSDGRSSWSDPTGPVRSWRLAIGACPILATGDRHLPDPGAGPKGLDPGRPARRRRVLTGQDALGGAWLDGGGPDRRLGSDRRPG